MWAPRIWKVGLVGGIGAGKSNAISVLTKLGAPTIDADKLGDFQSSTNFQIGHRTYFKGTESFSQIVSLFGPGCVDPAGEIDRKFIGSKVFADPSAMKKLTDIVWPEIHRLAKLEILQLQEEGSRVVFLEAAILIEAKWFDLVDELWVMSVPPEVACERIMRRNGLSQEKAIERIQTQLSNKQREQYASVVIRTDQPVEKTNVVIEGHYNSLLSNISSVPLEELRRKNPVPKI